MSDTMRPAAGERARWRDLLRLSWREWQHHPGRHAVALLAVALGVALAFSVHLINRSALAEFAAAVRTTSGEPDLALQAQADAFDDALFDRVAQAEGVAHASPVLDLQTYARRVEAAVRLVGRDPPHDVEQRGRDDDGRHAVAPQDRVAGRPARLATERLGATGGHAPILSGCVAAGQDDHAACASGGRS